MWLFVRKGKGSSAGLCAKFELLGKQMKGLGCRLMPARKTMMRIDGRSSLANFGWSHTKNLVPTDFCAPKYRRVLLVPFAAFFVARRVHGEKPASLDPKKSVALGQQNQETQ